jgi:hypothetical protein
MACSAINPDYQVPFSIDNSPGKTTISYSTFMNFETLKCLVEDLGTDELECFPPIPSQKDALGNAIEYDTPTLKKFIHLFETSITESEDVLLSALNAEYTNFEEIKKFLILINYLDNNKFLHILAKFSAQLIRDGKAQLV